MAYGMNPRRSLHSLCVALILGLITAFPALAIPIPRIARVVISVASLRRSEAVYTSIMGFRVAENGDSISPAWRQLWKLPPRTMVKWALLNRPDAHGGIEILLAQFTPRAPRARYEYRDQDVGIMGLHVCVPHVTRAYQALTKEGFTSMHSPYQWRGGGGELGVGRRAWPEVFMHGFDGEEWIIIPGNARAPKDSGGCATSQENALGFSPIHDVVLSVNSADKAFKFYHQVLGWVEAEPRWEAFGPDLETMLRMPRGVVAISIHMSYPDSPKVARLDPTVFTGVPKINISRRDAPPYRGLVVLSIKVPNADLTYHEVAALGYKVVTPPLMVPDKPYGDAKVFSLRGPGSVFMEFIQQRKLSTISRNSHHSFSPLKVRLQGR